MVFNGAQFHLLVNHIPVIGFLGVVTALLVAMRLKNAEIQKFVLGATAVVGLSSLAAFWTGEPAEEVIEDLPGVSEKLIHEHEEAGEFATILAVATGVLAAGALLVIRRRPEFLSKLFVGVLVLSAITLAALGRTAHEGGKIRHPEIRNPDAGNVTEKDTED